MKLCRNTRHQNLVEEITKHSSGLVWGYAPHLCPGAPKFRIKDDLERQAAATVPWHS